MDEIALGGGSNIWVALVCILIGAAIMVFFLEKETDPPVPSNRQSNTCGMGQAKVVAPRKEGSTEAKALRSKLGLNLGATVTLSLNNTVITLGGEGYVLQPGALDTLKLFSQVTTLILIVKVADDNEERFIKSLALLEGIIGEADAVVPHHRLLFCSTQSGLCSMVRQISPMMHVSEDSSALDQLSTFVPHLVYVTGGSNSDQVPKSWRSVVSLAELCS